ncbi:MAG: hypothetical protein ACFB0D_16255 [Phormidesmis sp.]
MSAGTTAPKFTPKTAPAYESGRVVLDWGLFIDAPPWEPANDGSGFHKRDQPVKIVIDGVPMTTITVEVWKEPEDGSFSDAEIYSMWQRGVLVGEAS